jgi:hypothetical protein
MALEPNKLGFFLMIVGWFTPEKPDFEGYIAPISPLFQKVINTQSPLLIRLLNNKM